MAGVDRVGWRLPFRSLALGCYAVLLFGANPLKRYLNPHRGIQVRNHSSYHPSALLCIIALSVAIIGMICAKEGPHR